MLSVAKEDSLRESSYHALDSALGLKLFNELTAAAFPKVFSKNDFASSTLCEIISSFVGSAGFCSICDSNSTLSVLESESTLADLSADGRMAASPLTSCWNCSRVFSTVGDVLSDEDDFDLLTRSVGPMLSADFRKSLLDTFGDEIFGASVLVGDCGGSDFPLSGVLDFDADALARSLLTEIFDCDEEFASDELRVSDFTGDPSLLFGSAKLNLSDLCEVFSDGSDFSLSAAERFSLGSRLYLEVVKPDEYRDE